MRSIVRPIVVRPDEGAIWVAKLQSWILERVRNTICTEAWTEAADNDAVVALIVTQNKAGNHDVAAGANEGPGAEVTELRSGRSIEVVDFDQRDACWRCARVRLHDGRVITGRQGRVDS